MRLISYAVLATALTFALPATAVQRTFVASYGSDANTANNCAFTTPCRGFQAAHGITDSGGEVIALDAAGYGPITITKSISLIANSGFYAGIAVGTGSGITIATASVKVVLRGLNINGIGGTLGINMTNGSQLTVENCVISNLSTGINVATAAKVRINNTTLRDNIDGLSLNGGAAADLSQVKAYGHNDAAVFILSNFVGTTTLAVSDSIISNNSIGVASVTGVAGAIAKVSIVRSTLSNNSAYGAYTDAFGGGTPTLGIFNSMVTHNQVGLINSIGTLESIGHNFVRYNGTDTTGTITTIAPM